MARVTKTMAKKTPSAGRRIGSGKFVTLSDGRKLSVPPSGGKFTKVEIRKAVRAALAQTQEAKAG